MLHFVKLLLLHRHLLRTSMTNVDVNVSLGLSDKVRCPQSTFFDRNFDLSCVPPPESPVVNQREVEPEGCKAPIGALRVSHPLLEWERGQAPAK